MKMLVKKSISLRMIIMKMIILLILVNLTACSAHQEPVQPDNSQEVERTAVPTAAPEASLPEFDETKLLFEPGKYIRDDFCSKVFDYQKIDYGKLTLAVAENFVEEVDPKELALKVLRLYSDLYLNSPVPLEQEFRVFILSDPDIGECYSRENLLFVSPDELDSRDFLEEFLGAAAGIREYWMQSGLVSLALGEQPDTEVLRTWYAHTDDLDMTGLFIARFQEDWASTEEIRIAHLSAASLLQYALEVENIPPEELERKVNNDVRTGWLESLGVNRTVEYPYDGRFNGFIYYRKGNCSLNILAENIYFCMNKLADQEYFDEISEAEFLLNYAAYGRRAMEEYILNEAPSVSLLMDTEELIIINVRLFDPEDRHALAYTDGNTIMINRSAVRYSPLHEIVHTFNWNPVFRKDINTRWLAEGFAEYLGRLLPIYEQTSRQSIYEDLNGRVRDEEMGITVGAATSFWYCLDPEQLEAAREWYLAQGGQMETEEAIDPRLYTDAVSFATLYRDAYSGALGIPYGEKLKLIYPDFEWEEGDGLELSYTQAASFVGWLCDTYSINRVLDVYVNGAEDGLLDGKTYEELKSAWQADLIVKGEGIEIPYQS